MAHHLASRARLFGAFVLMIKRAFKGPLDADWVRDTFDKHLVCHGLTCKLCVVPVFVLYERNKASLIEIYVFNLTPR